MFKRTIIVIAMLMILLPTAAQDISIEELDYLDDIELALSATLSADTFKIEGEQLMEQLIEASGMDIEQDIFQTFEGMFVNDEDEQNAYVLMEQELTQSSEGFESEVLLTQELLILGDEFYVQFSDISPSMLEDFYPQEWELFEDAADDYQGLSLINAEQYLRLLDAQKITAPFSAITEIISEIEVLDSEEINGQNMDVYRASFDASLLFSMEYVDEELGIVNFDSFDFTVDDFQFEINDDSIIEYTYYVGGEDRLVHRVESNVEMILTIDGSALGIAGDMVLDQTLESVVDYYDFGVDVKLPRP